MKLSKRILSPWLFSLALLFCLWPSYSHGWDGKYDLHFQRWGVHYFPFESWHWWKSQAIAESGLNPKAVSWCGAQGLMQLMPTTARSLGVTNSWDEEMNIMGGIKYDRQVWGYFKNKDLMFAGYNCGVGNVQKAQRKTDCSTWSCVTITLSSVTGKHAQETINYVAHINKIYRSIQ